MGAGDRRGVPGRGHVRRAASPGAAGDAAEQRRRRAADGRRPSAGGADLRDRPSAQPFTEADVEVAEQLGLQLSLVLARGAALRARRPDVAHPQASLLPPSPPDVAGLSTAVRYLAATHGVEVGGDFYDVVRLPNAQVALAVGDVVGHDITAARRWAS